MEKIYIFGHKKPDTDSICGSISLSYLKNQMGYNTEAMALGNINNETKFVLKYFGLKEPKYLNDVKLQIKDVDYMRNCYAYDVTSINEAYNYMKENNLSGLPIVNKDKKLTGLLTLKELARELINGDLIKIKTSYKNILETLKANEVLKFDDEIEGNLLTAAYRSITFIENIVLHDNDILIVGDRQNIIEYAVKSHIKLIIITGDGEISKENLEKAKENKVNIIKTSYDTFHTTKLINLSNYVSSVPYSTSPISFDENEYYTQFQEVAQKTKHTNYPIVDKDGYCKGLLHITFSNVKHPKKVILVDHNEKSQTVDGIEEASIVEVIDHHKLGTLATSLPINFRNMAVGSANTIIYNIYKENNVEIPKSIAGAMLSAIISDTLLLKSPTTTPLDRTAVSELEVLAGVSYFEYGMEMFKAGSSLKGKTKEEIIYEDFKKFTVNDKNIGIGQVFTTDIDSIMNEKEGYIKILDDMAKNQEFTVVAIFITDIIKNGSYILYNTSSERVLMDSFDLDILKQGHYFQDLVSRKKQFIPPIMEALEK